MNLADRSAMSAADFLSWADEWPEGQRYELVSGEPVAMSPERAQHSLVKLDCAFALRQAIREASAGCTVFGDGMSVVVSDDTVYEPDVTVQCDGPIDYQSPIVAKPSIVVEVLSPSTKSIDTGRKLIGYFQLVSVAHYLVVDADLRVVTHHNRLGEQIGTTILRDGTLRLDPPGIEFEITSLFTSLS